jgi:hypothetical protein
LNGSTEFEKQVKGLEGHFPRGAPFAGLRRAFRRRVTVRATRTREMHCAYTKDGTGAKDF